MEAKAGEDEEDTHHQRKFPDSDLSEVQENYYNLRPGVGRTNGNPYSMAKFYNTTTEFHIIRVQFSFFSQQNFTDPCG